MKPVLYWTLVRNFGRYSALAVTSEGPRGRINGRYTDNAPTHTNARSCVGRFDTATAALEKIDAISAIRKDFDEQRKPLQRQIQALHSIEEQEIKDLLK